MLRYRFAVGFIVPGDVDGSSSFAAAAVVSPSSAVKNVFRGNDGGERDEGETRPSTATGGVATGVTSGSRAESPRTSAAISASAAAISASAGETASTAPSTAPSTVVLFPATRARVFSAFSARALARSNSAVAFSASARNAAVAASPFSASVVSCRITAVAAATSSFAWRLTCSTASAFDRRAESRRISRSATRARQRGEDSSLAQRLSRVPQRRGVRATATTMRRDDSARQNVTSASAAESAVAAVDGSIGIVTSRPRTGRTGRRRRRRDAAFATVRVTSTTASGAPPPTPRTTDGSARKRTRRRKRLGAASRFVFSSGRSSGPESHAKRAAFAEIPRARRRASLLLGETRERVVP